MKKTLVMILCLMVVVSIAGCALSDYLKGNIPAAGNESSDKEDSENDSISEIDEVLDEVDSNVGDAASAKETNEKIDEGNFLKISVKENDKVRLKPKAKDPNEDKIAYVFSEPLDKNGEWQTHYGDAGNYLVTVTASDGKLTTSKKVLLTVIRVNVPPVIGGVASEIRASEGDTVSLDLKVSDPNGDRVTTSISKPFNSEGIWKIGYKERGTYNVTVTASDGEKQAAKSFKVIVAKKNVPPTLQSIQDLSINEGDKIEVNPVVDDLNGDKIKVTISDPVGDDGVWQTGYTSRGTYEIKVAASDGTATTTEIFKLTVKPVNKAPEIIEISAE